MLWTGLGMSLVGVIIVIAVILTKRPVDAAGQLGCVSDHWIAQHRVAWP
jgi:hypothetical protein